MLDFSDFIKYLIRSSENSYNNQLPSLVDISQSLGINIAKLREQLEVARVLGFVDVKPRTGIKRLPYQFQPAVKQSVSYAISIDNSYFDTFSDFRKRIESAYWFDAAKKLEKQDLDNLLSLLETAERKLLVQPVQIPHREHRDLHLCIFSRINNPFVTGVLETYWDIYQSIGLDRYTELSYLQQVWAYHRQIVESLTSGNLNKGYQSLIEHMGLLITRKIYSSSQLFE